MLREVRRLIELNFLTAAACAEGAHVITAKLDLIEGQPAELRRVRRSGA